MNQTITASSSAYTYNRVLDKTVSKTSSNEIELQVGVSVTANPVDTVSGASSVGRALYDAAKTASTLSADSSATSNLISYPYSWYKEQLGMAKIGNVTIYNVSGYKGAATTATANTVTFTIPDTVIQQLSPTSEWSDDPYNEDYRLCGNLELTYHISTFFRCMRRSTYTTGSTPLYVTACASSYTSIVDGLKSVGYTGSYSERSNFASLNGISNYTGTASQNIALLNLLKAGQLIRGYSSSSSNTVTTTKDGYRTGTETITVPFVMCPTTRTLTVTSDITWSSQCGTDHLNNLDTPTISAHTDTVNFVAMFGTVSKTYAAQATYSVGTEYITWDTTVSSIHQIAKYEYTKYDIPKCYINSVTGGVNYKVTYSTYTNVSYSISIVYTDTNTTLSTTLPASDTLTTLVASSPGTYTLTLNMYLGQTLVRTFTRACVMLGTDVVYSITDNCSINNSTSPNTITMPVLDMMAYDSLHQQLLHAGWDSNFRNFFSLYVMPEHWTNPNDPDGDWYKVQWWMMYYTSGATLAQIQGLMSGTVSNCTMTQTGAWVDTNNDAISTFNLTHCVPLIEGGPKCVTATHTANTVSGNPVPFADLRYGLRVFAYSDWYYIKHVPSITAHPYVVTFRGEDNAVITMTEEDCCSYIA